MPTQSCFSDLPAISHVDPCDSVHLREMAKSAIGTSAIHVLIAHAVPLVSAGLMAVLGCEQDMDVACLPATRQSGWQIPGRGFPYRVIIADPDTAGPLSADGWVSCPNSERAKLLVVLAGDDTGQSSTAVRTDADGCFVLGTAVKDLVHAVRVLAAGGRCCATSPALRHYATTPVDRPCGGLAPGALKRVKTHVEQRLAEKIDLADLAAIARLSECHFSRAFKQSTGMPPHRYLMAKRVEAAATLIRQTDQSLTAISLEVGFSDQSHFTRTFARATGETPSAFRHRHR